MVNELSMRANASANLSPAEANANIRAFLPVLQERPSALAAWPVQARRQDVIGNIAHRAELKTGNR
jgi:hypothetical protein